MPAKKQWIRFLNSDIDLITNNYVLVETFALVQNRLGIEAVRTFQEDILPLLKTVWINELDHKMGIQKLLATGRRKLSLVDCVSFETMRQFEIKTAFVFDSDFAEQGFETVP